MAVSLTRVVRFSAAHRMFRPDRNEAANRREFGAVSEWHEHQYECAVTVSGTPDAGGMVVDLAALDALLHEEVVLRLAGQRLNTLPGFDAGHPLPTCEALADQLYQRLAPQLPSGVRLDCVRVAEDPTLYAERRREA